MNPLFVIPKLLFYLIVSFLALGTIAGALIETGRLEAAAGANLGAGLLANWMSLRLFERLPFWAVGFSLHAGVLRNCALGFLAGAACFVVLVGIPVTLGAARWEFAAGYAFHPLDFLYTAILLLVGAAGEELLIRGYFLQVLAPAISPTGAIVFTSAVFAILHGANDSVTNLALINTALYGVVLGYALLRSRDLWLPTAVHFAWNWTSILTGTSLSGFTLEGTGIVLRPVGSELLTGGDYGPEGSLTATIMAAVLFLVVHWLPVVQGQAPLLAKPEKEI
jgi:membrane protease YdiL (CAAX protease family)